MPTVATGEDILDPHICSHPSSELSPRVAL
jgi:hypothetical protein